MAEPITTTIIALVVAAIKTHEGIAIASTCGTAGTGLGLWIGDQRKKSALLEANMQHKGDLATIEELKVKCEDTKTIANKCLDIVQDFTRPTPVIKVEPRDFVKEASAAAAMEELQDVMSKSHKEARGWAGKRLLVFRRKKVKEPPVEPKTKVS
jgi:hypothetical protein